MLDRRGASRVLAKRQDDGGFRRLDLSANIITMHWLQLVTRWRTLWSFVRRSGAMPFPRCNVCTVGREHGDGGRIIQASNCQLCTVKRTGDSERDSALTKRLAPIKLGVS